MAFIPIPHTCKVLLGYKTPNSKVMSNIVYFSRTNFTQTEMETMVENLRDWWRLNILPLLGAPTLIQPTLAYDMRTVDGPTYTVNDFDTATGGVTGAASPASIAVVVTLRTASRGRFARGRLYQRGFVESQTSDNAFESGIASTVAAAWDGLIGNAAISGWTWVVASRQEDGVVLSEGKTRPIIAAVSRTSVFGHQRRSVNRI